MQASRLSGTLCLWGACAAAGLSALPALAQSPPVAGALTPVQGATAALTRIHQAKSLAEMNSCVTRQTAAVFGLGLMLDGTSSGLGKAFEDKATTLRNRYSLTDKALDTMEKSNTLPPGLVPRGHQFLADALILKEEYEKNLAPGKKEAFEVKYSGSDFPAPRNCTFRVLSPARVEIAPRSDPNDAIEARLEDGQWRIDIATDEDIPVSSKPLLQTITPQAAAFLKAVKDNDAATVGRMLKATPALANTPPAYLQGLSGEISDLPLSIAALQHNLQIAALLLKAGANPNVKNYFEQTALEQVAFLGDANMVTLLLAHGADVRHRNTFGKTALHEAVEGDHPDIIRVLLAHGADVNARDDEGKTPLAEALDPAHQALYHAAVLKLLRQHDAKK